MDQLKEKMKVVMLPTEKANMKENDIVVNDETKIISFTRNNFSFTKKYFTPQHLYIISNKEIKEGDITLNTFGTNNTIFKVTKLLTDGYEGQKLDDENCFYGLQKTLVKIEASTDKSLNLPLIPEGFVRKYCELQGKIDDVMVDIEYVVTNEDWSKRPVQLDGYYKTKTDKNNYITITKVKTTFTLDEMFMNMQYYMEYCQTNMYVTPQDWLEKYKHF